MIPLSLWYGKDVKELKKVNCYIVLVEEYSFNTHCNFLLTKTEMIENTCLGGNIYKSNEGFKRVILVVRSVVRSIRNVRGY